MADDELIPKISNWLIRTEEVGYIEKDQLIAVRMIVKTSVFLDQNNANLCSVENLNDEKL
jgi:hypothetical protein